MSRPRKYFAADQLTVFHQAVSVSEDVISDHFQLTMSSWRKYRYDIRTLKQLTDEETAPEVFAQIIRYARPTPPEGLREGDFYSICVQDHNINRAFRREPKLMPYPFFIYILTHELIHVVRFYKFMQFFHADPREREAEEVRVHQLTFELLKPVGLAGLDRIFDYYADHRELLD